MKKREIKTKVLITLTILMVGILVFYKDIYWFGVKNYNDLVPNDHKIAISMQPARSLKDEKARLELLLTEESYNLYQLARIGDGMMMGSTRIKSHDALRTYEAFKLYNADGKLLEDEADYVLDVILVQWFGGNVKEAKELIASMKLDGLNEKQVSEVYIIKSAMNLTDFDLEALNINLDRITYEQYLDIPLGIRSYIDIFINGNSNVKAHEVEYKKIEEDKYLSYFNEIFSNLRTVNGDYNDNKETRTLSNKISGYVLLNGQGVEGALVYPKYRSGMSTIEGFDNEYCITDQEGYYEFTNTPVNLKSLSLAVPWQRFHDKQIQRYRDFDWTANNNIQHNFEFYDGVHFNYLKVNNDVLEYEIVDPLASETRSYFFSAILMNENMSSNFTSIDYDIKNTELSGAIPIDTLRKHTDFPFNYSSSDDALAIERFMEPLYLSGDYVFRIAANDEGRDSYTWNGLSSDALSSTVWIDGEREYNQGDKLLEKKDIEGAKAWYANNPSLHNLRVLIALYSRGTTVVEGEYDQELMNAEPEKAIPYLEQMIELYGSTNRLRLDLAGLYKDLGDYKNEERVLLDNLNYDPSVYDYFRLGYNYMNQGRYNEGITVFLENGDMSVDATRYYDYFIIGDVIEPLPEKIRKHLDALEGKEDFVAFYTLVKDGKTQEAYNWLLKAPDSELKELYIINILNAFGRSSWNAEGHSILSFDDYKSYKNMTEEMDLYFYYNDVYESTKNPSIKKIYELLNPTWVD